MPSDKHNSEMARATDLISSLFNVASSQDVLFANRSSSNACIMVLPKLTFVLHFFLHYRIGGVPRHGFMEDLVNAVIAEVFLVLSFCLKPSV